MNPPFLFRIVRATNGLLRDAQGTGAHPIQFDVHDEAAPQA